MPYIITVDIELVETAGLIQSVINEILILQLSDPQGILQAGDYSVREKETGEGEGAAERFRCV